MGAHGLPSPKNERAPPHLGPSQGVRPCGARKARRFSPRKSLKNGPLRYALTRRPEQSGGTHPLKGVRPEKIQRKRGQKNEIHHQAESETGGAIRPAAEKGVLQVAGTTKKTAPKRSTTPAVLTGTVPEWANSTAIAQLLGKTTRRVQQLTQDGILETEVPPGGGARKYRTCETIQRYIAHVEQKAQEIGEGGRLAELNLKKLEAEVALKESQGSLHRLKTAIAEGKYLPAEQRGTGGVYGGLSKVRHDDPGPHGRGHVRVCGRHHDPQRTKGHPQGTGNHADGLCGRHAGGGPAGGRAVRKYRVKPYKVPRWMVPAIEILRPRERVSTSAWAEQNRVLPNGNAIPGPWRNNVTPYLVEIMDAFSDETTEKIVFVKPTQVGGTSAMENALGSLIDQDPAPAMFVYPSDELAERTVEAKLEPMIRQCKALAEKYREHDSKRLALKFRDMIVYLTGANSPASLASTPIRYLFLDEVDKFPGATKKEADPVSLAIERTKTFFNRKIFMASTPTLKTGPIWKAKEEADAEKHYFVPCPHCGEFIELKFAQIKWPSKDDVPDQAERAEMATYVCQACGCIITDRDKAAMLQAGRWQIVRQTTTTPKSVAYWMNTLYSPFTRFSDIAREFMRAKDDPELLHNFVNSWLAEPWEDTKLKTNAEMVMERQTEVPAWSLPAWTKLLTGGIDVQENCLYWVIRAWGDFMTSQNVAHGQALSMAEVERIMNTEFSLPDGGKVMVDLALMDSGDQTDAVYEFCTMNMDWVRPCKGVPSLQGHYKISTVDKAGSRANGMQLVLVDGGKYKDMIAGRMRRPNGNGSWMVHKDCDLEYAEQVTAEHKITERAAGKEVQRWVLKSSHADNHYLDCEVYAAAAADVLEVRSLFLKNPDRAEEQAPKPAPPKPQPAPEETWIQQNENWF